MTINPIAMTIRAKKLGVLIRDARLTAGKSVDECAQSTGLENTALEAFELGEKAPSLPELEALAYVLKVPLEQFWGDQITSGSDGRMRKARLFQISGLRQRIIGAKIRQARQEAGVSLETLAEQAAITASLLEAYELGDQPIPLPTLEVLSSLLNRSIQDFRNLRSALNEGIIQQHTLHDFSTLPSEMQAFVCRPINRPYLELAQRLSEMPADKLRAIAEGLLAITL
jgi:transcriptional regulator with XRE-family HTH domain